MSGRHIGKTGMVMGSEGSVANIITDISKEIIQVLFNDLIYSEEVSTGFVAEHNFKVNDIVTLNNERGFGIVIKADNEYVRAIMDSGDARNI
mmetsp:Transcript_31326/g.5643  ORF Transcript_31326/g.5643 Transcript_31326/m.5643 type:complete len:92 (+) Transcript_31326:1177-1452(+)